MEIIRIATTAVNAALINPPKEVAIIASKIMSYEVSGAEFSKTYKQGVWSGTSSFYKFKGNTFPAGFVDLLRLTLQNEGYVVHVARKPLPQPLGPEMPVVDSFPIDKRYDYQEETMNRLINRGRMIAQIATGGGKCLGFGTPVLMYDGSIKPVQEIVAGEKLMGPDSLPKTVKSICSGSEEMFKVTPTKGDSYIVNRSHILSLKITKMDALGKKKVDGFAANEIANISVNDYLSKSKTFKHCAKGWRTGVDFVSHVDDFELPPYILGIWLGDGSSNAPEITKADIEVMDEWIDYVYSRGDKTRDIDERGCVRSSASTDGKGPCHMRAHLKSLNLLKNKHIPHIYKTAKREERLNLLAGIIDTDGYLHNNTYDIVIKQECLANDVAFVARSLGFAAYISKCNKGIKSSGFVGEYFRINISGDICQIPCRVERRKAAERQQIKNVLNTGIKVESIGQGDYYGFELDGDGLFLLGDFTVTHNTKVAKLCYKRINRMTLFLTTRGVLMHQMKESFEEMGENVGVIGDGELKIKKGINVGMVQTFASMLKDPKRSERTKQILNMFEFVILEEAHEASGNSYYEILSHCKNAHYRLALTATPFMRSNDEDNMRLRACVGEVGIKVSERTLISRGILAKPYFKYIDVEKPNGLFKTTSWQAAYRIGVVENAKRNETIAYEVKRATFYGLKSIVLVQHKAHGENIQKILTNADVKCMFVYGEHNQEERKAAFNKLKSGEINCLIGSTIIDVGVDIPAVSFVVLAGGGKAEVALRQRIGRGLREKRGSPNVTFVVDFTDRHNKHTKEHADSRKKIVEMTPGFSENIIKPGMDFNYGLIQNG
jgi:superfamily II DNA or RNA helicase